MTSRAKKLSYKKAKTNKDFLRTRRKTAVQLLIHGFETGGPGKKNPRVSAGICAQD